MQSKQQLSELFEQTTKQVTYNMEQWTGLLTTMGSYTSTRSMNSL